MCGDEALRLLWQLKPPHDLLSLSCTPLVGPGRYIIASKFCVNLRAEDVTDTVEMALTSSGCNRTDVRHKLRQLSDNGICRISGDLVECL